MYVDVYIEFCEEILGSQPGNEQIHSDFISSKAPDAQSREEEIAALGVDEFEKKEKSIFYRMEDGTPCLMDYQWKGFFKEALSALKKHDGAKASMFTAFKKNVDLLVFPSPRMMPFVFPDDFSGELGDCQRSLRASTAQGDRTCLANSETVPIGSTMYFKLDCRKKDFLPLLIKALEYGETHGTGQWRNSGKGRFYSTITNYETDEIIATNNPRDYDVIKRSRKGDVLEIKKHRYPDKYLLRGVEWAGSVGK